MVILARDKLREAEFFLDKLSGRTGRDFRYYLSAFLSAARSVTWVLQAELRPKFAAEFDEWYEPYQQSLGRDRTARLVKHTRNALLKRGSKEPSYMRTWRSPVGKDSITASYTVDQLAYSGDIQVSITLGLDPGPISVEIDEGQSLEEQRTQAELQVEQHLEEQFHRALPDLLPRIHKLVDEVEPEVLLSFHDDEEPYSMEDLHSDLKAYVGKLTEIIDEAEARFTAAD